MEPQGAFSDSVRWLLEPDAENPGPRLFALREFEGRAADDPDVVAAQRAVMERGPVPAILVAQNPEGWWEKPGAGYSPKYRGTVWSVMFLAQLGADGKDPRVRRACDYMLDHGRAAYGGFSCNAGPAYLVQCLQGNLCAALLDLGWFGDPRLDAALDYMARSVTGEGIAPATEKDAPVRYYRSGNSGPGFLCSANNHEACAWAAVKVMWALGKVPESARTPAMKAAIQVGADFLMGSDPAVADYPHPWAPKPSTSWFQFGYPVAYVTDVLQNLEVLTSLGFGGDPRLKNALDLVRSKRDAQGRWLMKYSYKGKMWADVEKKGKPSKWVTLRAVRVLSRAH